MEVESRSTTETDKPNDVKESAPTDIKVDDDVYFQYQDTFTRGRVIFVEDTTLTVMLERVHAALCVDNIGILKIDMKDVQERSRELESKWEEMYGEAQSNAKQLWNVSTDTIETPFKRENYVIKYAERSRRGKWLQLKQVLRHEAYDKIDTSKPTCTIAITITITIAAITITISITITITIDISIAITCRSWS